MKLCTECMNGTDWQSVISHTKWRFLLHNTRYIWTTDIPHLFQDILMLKINLSTVQETTPIRYLTLTEFPLELRETGRLASDAAAEGEEFQSHHRQSLYCLLSFFPWSKISDQVNNEQDMVKNLLQRWKRNILVLSSYYYIPQTRKLNQYSKLANFLSEQC